ncbi:MAG: aromatic ring-hydroxylating dioxygenase subunit alpha [Planctomycetaceae bacterium]|nr:aromatic ring-hydroxylating dioxygenase subunit alpha [Planctomycetaceae bacterium]
MSTSNQPSPEDRTLHRQWFVACLAGELRSRPFSRTVLGTPIVLFRGQGKIVALLDRCPHRNVPLSAGKVIGDCVQCPYHGWQFDSTGACVHRPGVIDAAPQPIAVTEFPVVEQGGQVWINLDPGATHSPPSRPWHADPAFGHFHWIDSVEATFADAIENLLDGTHTPFVHSGLVRSASQQQRFSAIVRVKPDYVEAEYLNEGKQSGWISQLFERDRAASYGRFVPPCVAELEYTSQRGTEFVLNAHFTPESPTRLRVYSTVSLRKTLVPMFLKRLLVTPLFRRVLNQDRHILEQQQANIHRFGQAEYTSWDADLLRGFIDHWLRTGILPVMDEERRVEFEL